MAEIMLTFPDGARRSFKKGITGRELAESISKSLAKKAVAVAIDGKRADLADPIAVEATVKIITRNDPEALELIRHDCAHVLAEAVQDLFPGTQVTIGPVIENGFFYDFHRSEPFHPGDLPKIEARMHEIIARDAPFTKQVWTREKAKAFFGEKGETFKVELIDAIPKGEQIRIYKQGNWADLCRGPHMTSTGQIGKAFKLQKIAGGYGRGDAKNAQLQRIYGTAWATEQDLAAYLRQLEEAEKRDHRRLGREMDLFHFQEDAPGTVFWHPKGWTLFQALMAYMRRRQEAEGYFEVNSPQLLDRSLWETSGHWEKYRELMFVTETEDERVFALKPMNCPGHVQIFKHGLRSYRELPLKIAEFGCVHRYEPSGALHGLMRVRAFTQDDAHIFCTPEQIHDECMRVNNFMLSIYEDFGFTELTIKLATRPDKRVGAKHLWDAAEGALAAILDEVVASSAGKIKRSINPGEGTFYGPKFEYVLRDAIGRDWQCGTTQVDFNLPERFGAFYVDHDGQKKTPVMVHRAICGSMERFLGILIESTAGHFPLWLAPLQAMVCTIVSEADAYANEVLSELKRAGLRADIDLRNEKINYKVREHSVSKVPVLLVAGKREAEERTVSVRRLGSPQQRVMKLADAIRKLSDEGGTPGFGRGLRAKAG